MSVQATEPNQRWGHPPFNQRRGHPPLGRLLHAEHSCGPARTVWGGRFGVRRRRRIRGSHPRRQRCAVRCEFRSSIETLLRSGYAVFRRQTQTCLVLSRRRAGECCAFLPSWGLKRHDLCGPLTGTADLGHVPRVRRESGAKYGEILQQYRDTGKSTSGIVPITIYGSMSWV